MMVVVSPHLVANTTAPKNQQRKHNDGGYSSNLF
jgi:hypothetical protein